MKKSAVMIMAMMFLFAALTTVAFAGNGRGVGDGSGPLTVGLGSPNDNGSGAGDGSGPIHDILSGTPFIIEGEVISSGIPGNGIVVATADGNILIYGLGPISYWTEAGLEKPAVGDTITVEGFTVDYNGEYRNIATSVTIDSTTLDLRDLETGLPLWVEK